MVFLICGISSFAVCVFTGSDCQVYYTIVSAPDPGDMKSDAEAGSSSDATLPFYVQRHR